MHQDVLSAGTLSTRLISSQGHRPSATSAQLSSKLKLWKKLRPKLWRELRGIPTNSQGKEDCCLLPRRILKIKGKKEESEIRMNVRVDNGGDDLILGLPIRPPNTYIVQAYLWKQSNFWPGPPLVSFSSPTYAAGPAASWRLGGIQGVRAICTTGDVDTPSWVNPPCLSPRHAAPPPLPGKKVLLIKPR